jgi:ADP-heptose:LPS heptosyltransferase
MLENTRHSLGAFVARWQFRHANDELITFTNSISQANRILLIVPLLRDDFAAMQLVDLLRGRVPEDRITVVTGNHGLDILRTLPRSRFVHLLPEQISPLFLPRHDFMTAVREKEHDVAIDLNLDFVLPSGYICKASGARVRIGFARPSADLFYNFQITHDPTLGRKLVYDRLVQCLEKF